MKQSADGPLRVLCIDGGGMRGLYSAAYLSKLEHYLASKRPDAGHEAPLDLGRAFDLIVGTSTGGLMAIALAHGLPAQRMVDLYRDHGAEIFPEKVPSRLGLDLVKQVFTRPSLLEAGDIALRTALSEVFGSTTFGELYRKRGVALAIPAVDMANHRGWIFKTRHLPQSVGRDDNVTLVDACMATSAAPVFRSLAAIDHPDGTEYQVFADGGLFANSPLLVGLIDALALAESGQVIHLFGLGTCKAPGGRVIDRDKVHMGLVQWAFGAKAVSLAMEVQDQATLAMVRHLQPHLTSQVELVMFPSGTVSAEHMHLLEMDDASEDAARVLVMQAETDVQRVLEICNQVGHPEGELINELIRSAPRMDREE